MITSPLVKKPVAFSLVSRLVLAVLLVVAVAFVGKYVFYYYLHYNRSAYEAVSPRFWSQRFWVLLHITTGTVAILLGPFQFSSSLRRNRPQLHRNLGKTFFIAIFLGSIAAFRLVFNLSDAWGFGAGLFGLGIAWISTASVAWYAILRRQFQTHKEWTIRTYVVTWAFVLFRAVNDYGPTSRLTPVNDLVDTAIWASWTIPLLITEVIFAIRRISHSAAG